MPKRRGGRLPQGAAKYVIKRHLFRLQSGLCAYCNEARKLKHLTIDHVMPVAVNGPDDFTNLLLACEPCNQAKGNSLPTLEFHEAIRRRIHWALSSLA